MEKEHPDAKGRVLTWGGVEELYHQRKIPQSSK